MTRCRHKIGLLALKDCGKPVVALCSECNRPVCERHRKMYEQTSMCLECYVQHVEDEDMTGEIGRVRHRHYVYHDYGYSPYYYGHARRYGNDDYNYFEEDSASSAEYDNDMEPGDFQDS